MWEEGARIYGTPKLHNNFPRGTTKTTQFLSLKLRKRIFMGSDYTKIYIFTFIFKWDVE